MSFTTSWQQSLWANEILLTVLLCMDLNAEKITEAWFWKNAGNLGRFNTRNWEELLLIHQLMESMSILNQKKVKTTGVLKWVLVAELGWKVHCCESDSLWYSARSRTCWTSERKSNNFFHEESAKVRIIINMLFMSTWGTLRCKGCWCSLFGKSNKL